MGKSNIREQILVALHVAAWSQVGVLVRIYLDKFFLDGCSGEWGVCLLSQGSSKHNYGAYFPDLASNMLGSFVMGLLTASYAHHPDTKAVVILPDDHIWQDTPELLVGLRTGFCGSLTTFASWEFALVTNLIGGKNIQGGQWDQFLWGLVIGFQLSLSSYMFGVHSARVVQSWYSNRLTLIGRSAKTDETESQPSQSELQSGESAQGNSGGKRVAGNGEDRGQKAEVIGDGFGAEEQGLVGSTVRVSQDGWDLEERGGVPEKDSNKQQSSGFTLLRKTNLATLLLFSCLTALWIALAVVDSSGAHEGRRQQWFALLFAPFGAMLRWKLALLNGKLPSFSWFPVGTFAANIGACCVDFGMQAGLQRADRPGYWLQLLLGAVRTGFSGSLSTVSTFVAEVHKMPGETVDNIHGYIYAFTTIALGALSGVVIYGWSVWA